MSLLRRKDNLAWLRALTLLSVMNILGEQFRQGCSLPLDVPIHLMLWVDDAQLAHREAEAAGWPDLGRQIGEALDGWGTW